MNVRFRTACALFASLALLGVTIGTFASPASADSSQCKSPCNLHIGRPPAIATGAAEVGLQFSSDLDGWIGAVCFWEAPTETGNHTVSLWDSSGAQLATATSTVPGIPGTEGCVDFNPFVQISANTTYTVSYTSNTAYGIDPQLFQFSGLNIPPLHAPIQAPVTGAAGSFPSTDHIGDAYGVDVAFLSTLTGTIGDCISTLTAPTNPSSGPGSNAAAVSWFPATSDPPGCIAGYVVTTYLNGVPQGSTLISGTGTTTVISGLTNGNTYSFTIAAESGRTVGPPSPETTVTVGTPTAPTAMKVSHVSNGVRLAFKASRNNGAAVTKYTATCKARGRTARSKAGKASPLTVTGLHRGTNYTCTVRGTNRRGNGPSSRSVTAKG